jgi:hypothetical protein
LSFDSTQVISKILAPLAAYLSGRTDIALCPPHRQISPLTTAISTTVLRCALIRDLGKLSHVHLTLPLISLKIEVFENTPPRRYLNPLLLRSYITIGAQVWLLPYVNMRFRHSLSCERDLDYEFSSPYSPSSQIRLRLPRDHYRPTSSSDRAFYRRFLCSLRQQSTKVPPQTLRYSKAHPLHEHHRSSCHLFSSQDTLSPSSTTEHSAAVLEDPTASIYLD